MAVITLRGEANNLNLETNEIARIRHITESEKSFHPTGASRVDYVNMLYVRNTVDDAIAVIKAAGEGGKFASLTMPDKEPVWFRGPSNSKGPIPIPPSMRNDGILSSLYIGGKIQFVRESPDIVSQVLTAVGGTVIPILDMQIFSEFEARRFNQLLSSDAVWDSDISELRVNSPLARVSQHR